MPLFRGKAFRQWEEQAQALRREPGMIRDGREAACWPRARQHLPREETWQGADHPGPTSP